MPITLALACVEAQKQGAASILSVARLGEALVGWGRSAGAAVFSLVTVAGVVSILITIDDKVGESLFGGLQQVGRNYLQAMLDVGRLVLAAGAVLASGGTGTPVAGAAFGFAGGAGGPSASGGGGAGLPEGGEAGPRAAAGGLSSARGSGGGSGASGTGIGNVAAQLGGGQVGVQANGAAGDDDHLEKFRALRSGQNLGQQVRDTAEATRLGTGLQTAGRTLTESANPALSFLGEAAGATGRTVSARASFRKTLIEQDQRAQEMILRDIRNADTVASLHHQKQGSVAEESSTPADRDGVAGNL